MASVSSKLIIPYNFLSRVKVGKYLILDHIFRNYSLFSKKLDRLIDSMGKDIISEVCNKLLIPESKISDFLESFLTELGFVREFLRECKINWYSSDQKRRYRHVKVYLHKVYRIAPVFDYKKARINLENLHRLLNMRNFWPHLTTQLAVVIYITDKKSGKFDLIQQKNIRALCNCSAYAFHRTRNKLELKNYL